MNAQKVVVPYLRPDACSVPGLLFQAGDEVSPIGAVSAFQNSGNGLCGHGAKPHGLFRYLTRVHVRGSGNRQQPVRSAYSTLVLTKSNG